MIFNTSRQTACLALLCAMFLSISASAQTFVRYVVPSDLGTTTLYLDNVLTSVTLPWGVSRVDNVAGVKEAASQLSDILKDKDAELLSVYVCGTASPDGLYQENLKLSKARTEATVRYLKAVTGISEDKIHFQSLEEDWDRLYELVEDSEIPYKDEVLDIIITKTWGERKQALKEVGGGEVWRILMQDIFPLMRCVRIGIYCRWDPSKPYMSNPSAEEVVEPEAAPTVAAPASAAPVAAAPVEIENEPEISARRVESRVDTLIIRDTVYYMKETIYMPQGYMPSSYNEPYSETRSGQYKSYRSKPVRPERPVYDSPWMMGFKTNLLGDAIVVPTLGAEFQLSRIISLDVQGFYTNYNVFNIMDRNTNVYGFSPELRFWPGGKTMRKGQFVGLHARCAWYTLQWTDDLLYQNGPDTTQDGNYYDAGNSTPAWSVGMTYGYSLGFGRKGHWGLEFLVGIGYANYRQNIAAQNNGVWEFVEHQDNHHFGITRAGVNLTYRFSLRKVKPEYYENN